MRKLVLFLLLPVFIQAQNIQPKKFEDQFSFVKNMGQFDDRNWQRESIIEYGIDHGKLCVFFTKQGLIYRFDKIIRNPNRDKAIHDSPKRTNISELIMMNWVDANENVQIIAEDLTDDYYSYAIKDLGTKDVTNINKIKAYKKLTYKNIYDNIDVEYVIHPESGLKYSLVLHPGADLSKIKMKYSNGHTAIGEESIKYGLNEKGQFVTETSLGIISETKPFTFYSDTKNEIESKFIFENSILSFDIENYDTSKEIVIDPWIVSPTLNSSNAVWEVETDGAGNVYIIGGETPMQLKKYNSTGAIQWTYTTPWDTASVWLGTLATNDFGECYITSGVSPEIEKINTSGGMIWHNTGPGSSDEYWSITANCDKSKLIVGGTKGPPLIGFTFESAIYDIDVNNGDVLATITFESTNVSGFGVFPIEVRSISSARNAKYVYLTHENVGAISQNIGACPSEEPIYHIDNGHNLGYKCENYLPATQNGGGLKAIISNDQFFYTHSGDQIHKRDLDNGSLITSVSLPGGANSSVPIFGGIIVECSGLDVDDCGNVYAGSTDRVVKFDADLNYISESAVAFSVYDVSVNSNGEIVAVGAEQDNQAVNRNGKIQSVDMSACAQYALVCCDANVCPVDPLCVSDSPVTLTPSSGGGSWSGPGVDPVTGVFDPTVAGVGSHTITYTMVCGYDIVVIEVMPCAQLTVCYDGVDIIATGGTGTIIWEDWESFNYPINNEQECIDCPTTTPEYVPIFNIYQGCSEDVCSGTGWVQYATGTTVAPPANWPLQISDDLGVVFTYNNISEIPPCSACTPPTLTNTSTNVSCTGGNDGSIDLTISGSSTYNVEWSSGPTSEDISGLSSGLYSVTVTDASNPACSATTSVTINDGTNPTPTITGNTAICAGSSTDLNAGAGYSSYSWTGGGTNQTLNVSPAITTTYYVTVTDANGCTGIDGETVTISSDLTANLTATSNPICEGESTQLQAGGGTIYNWSTSETSQSITVSPTSTTTYMITVSDVAGCTGTTQITIDVNPLPVADAGADQTICDGSSAFLTANGGTSYVWSTSETTQIINVSPTVITTYYLTVTDANGCTGTDDVTIDVGSNLIATINATENPICDGESTQLQAGGGTIFNWGGGETTQSITVSPNIITNYSVTVSDVTGCSGIAQILIDVNPIPVANAGADQTICFGSDATLMASGGTTYEWSTGDALQTIVVFPVSTSTYSVTVTDNGCSSVDNVVVNVTQEVVPDINVTAPVICEGQSTILDASGGTSYIWNTGDITQSIEVSPPGTTTYSVTVIDANGCSGSAQVQINVSDSVSVTLSPSVVCQGESAELTASVGTSYEWSTGDTTQTITVTPTATTIYTVTVSTAGCTGSADVEVSVNAVPVADAGPDEDICEGDSVTLIASGGTSYEWNTGAYTNSIVVSPSSSIPYFVTVTDNGCSSVDIVNVNVSPVPVADAGADQSVCDGTSVTLTASGGGTYEWSNGETTQAITVLTNSTTIYTVTVTLAGCTASDDVTVNLNSPPNTGVTDDLSICLGDNTTLTATGGTSYNWSTTSTDASINVSPGQTTTYFVTVSENGCSVVDSVTVTVLSSTTAAISATPSTICETQSSTLTATGGTSYLWSTGETTQDIDVSPGTTTTYYVTVTNNSCSAVADILITVNPSITAISSPSEICSGESTQLTVSSGSNYQWSTGETTQSITVAPLTTTAFYVTVSTSTCTDSTSVIVTVHSLPTADAGVDISTCAGNPVTLSASGGDTYLWSNSMTGSDITISPLSSAVYTVTVSSAFGCESTDDISVTVNPVPTALAGSDQAICEGETANFAASGGDIYSWSPVNGLSNATISNPLASPGTSTMYTVTVFNQYGCFDTDNLMLTVSPNLTIDVTLAAFPSDALCTGEQMSFTALSNNPGSNPNYQWFVNDLNVGTNSSSYSSTSLSDGDIVSCILTSSELCTSNNPATDNIVVSIHAAPKISIYAGNNRGCGPLIVTFSAGSNTSSTYYWNLGDNTNSTDSLFEHVYTSPGVYDVSVVATSDEGCSTTMAYTNMVEVYEDPDADFYGTPENTSLFDPVIQFTNHTEGSYIDSVLFGDGDTLLYIGGSNFVHDYNISGTFTVELIAVSNHGCIDSDSTNITIRPEYTFYAPTAITPTLDNLNDVFYVVGIGIDKTKFEMYIFDRWGEKIFYTRNYDPENPRTFGWDGTAKDGKSIVQNGCYSWVVFYTDLGGSQHEEKGSVTVIR